MFKEKWNNGYFYTSEILFCILGNCGAISSREKASPTWQNQISCPTWADIRAVPQSAQVCGLSLSIIWCRFSCMCQILQLKRTLVLTCFLESVWMRVVWTVNQTCAAVPRCFNHRIAVWGTSWSFRHFQAIIFSNANFLSRSSSFRSKIVLEASQALYLLISGKNVSCLSASMGEVYSQFRDPDGFLYITYASQDMFGWKHPRKMSMTYRSPHIPPDWCLSEIITYCIAAKWRLSLCITPKATQTTNTWPRWLFWPHFLVV